MPVRSLRPGLLIALAACCTLTGCIFPPEMRSRAIDIPQAERARAPDLVGTWWQFEDSGGRGDFRIVRIHQNPDRTLRFSYTERTNPRDESSTDDLDGKAILLKGEQPGVDLLLFTEKDATAYMLAVQSRAGSLVMYPFLGEMDAAIGKGRLGYLAAVAARHGIQLAQDKASDAIVLDGKLGRAALVALFSDAEFLGGLRLDAEDSVTLLPANRPLPKPDAKLAWWPLSFPWQLVSERFPIDPTELVQPPQLVGNFKDGTTPAKTSRQADGSLLIEYLPDPATEARRDSRRIRLVGIGEHDRLLALVEQSESGSDERQARPVFGYFLASQGQDGTWNFAPLQTVANDLSRPLDEAGQTIRQRAAERYGLAIAGSRLTGPLTLARIKLLIADPQFQAGLDARNAPVWFELAPAAAGQR